MPYKKNYSNQTFVDNPHLIPHHSRYHTPSLDPPSSESKPLKPYLNPTKRNDHDGETKPNGKAKGRGKFIGNAK